MNINFGMDNFYVRYLKRFLNHEMLRTSSVLGEFDKNDLELLIKYLNLPNVKTMFEVQKEIIKTFPELGDLFNTQLGDNVIIWTSKKIDVETSNFLRDNSDALKEFCSSVGWEIQTINDWMDTSKDINQDGSVDRLDRNIIYDITHGNLRDYDDATLKRADIDLDGFVTNADLDIFDNYLDTGKLSLTIEQTNRTNYFPNKDMLVFINQFLGTFIYGYAIRDNGGYDDLPHPSATGLHKIATYKCKPGQKVTIAHNNPNTVHLVIGSSPATLQANISNFLLTNVVEVDLKAGESYQYTCSSGNTPDGYDAHYLCIQCPSDYGNLSDKVNVTRAYERGDINFDGKIDMQDYHLLARYTAQGAESEQYKWEATELQKLVMDTNQDGNVTIEDAQLLYRFINGDTSRPSLGFVYYSEEITVDGELGTNVENLLIIDGHYDRDVNIPFKEFTTKPWVIHEKFFNYLFGMAIHKYSNSDDISYLQKLLKERFPQFSDGDYLYPGDYGDNVKSLVKNYQLSKVGYTIGDLNKDNKITSADLEIMRNLIDDSADYRLVRKYLANELTTPLTSEEFARLDIDGDEIITEVDRDKIKAILDKKYNDTVQNRADINRDSFVDDDDYYLLQLEVDGNTSNLKEYDIPFMLGWLDVQTEGLLEDDANPYGLISEVSK